MSAGKQGKLTNWQDDVIASKIQDEKNSTWGEIPGQIVSFNPQTQTATVQPLYKPQFNGKAVDMPQLLEVPVRFAQGGKGGMTFPIGVGDKVTLRPQMRSTENYQTDGDGEASDARAFNLSDMEAHISGGTSGKEAIKNFDASNTHVRFDAEGNHGIRGSKDGKIAIEGAEGNICELLAQVVELLGAETTSVNSGSSAGQWPLTHQSEFAAIAAKLRAMVL